MTYIARFKFLLGLGLAVALAACGGGGGDGGGGGSISNVPQARITASPGQSVQAGSEVTFDGGTSSSPSGGNITYKWTLITRPEGSAAALTNEETFTTKLTPDRAGTWTVSLVVNNGSASSDPAHLSITATEPPKPVAVIQPINGSLLGLSVQVDGQQSQPPAGGQPSALRYEWSLVEIPADSAAELDDVTLSTPRFTPDKEGAYKVRLIVHYDDQVSEPAEQTIEVFTDAPPPTAVAKVLTSTENRVRGQAVQLDASESSDPAGKPLNYFWRFGTTSGRPYPNTGRPNGSNAVIENPTSAQPTFTPDVAGTYFFQLMVWTGKRVAIAQVSVVVTKPVGATNTKPVAVISPASFSYSFEQEPGIGAQQRVSLGGSSSWDADGDALTREWTLLSYPVGFDPATSYTPGDFASFQPTTAGSYVAQLRVYDGTEWSDPVSQVYTIRTGANIGPIATIKTAVGGRASTLGGAQLRASTLVDQTVTLDGTQSSGGNGDQVFYSWELVYKPEGSQATLDEFRATHPKFTADKEGPYLVRLQVQDAYGLWSRNSPEILVVAKSANTPPVLRPVVGSSAFGIPTSDQPLLIGEGTGSPYFTIDPSALDPDGDVVDTLATLVQGPAGFVLPEIRQWTATAPEAFNSGTSRFIGAGINGNGPMNVSGTYVFQLIGSDGMDQSALHTVNVPLSTLADYPELLLRTKGDGDFSDLTSDYPAQRSLRPTYALDLSPFTEETWVTLPDDPATGIAGRGVYFELRAPAGKSYTIVNLKAESDDPTVPVRFIGLSEGQVITSGEPVVFRLAVQRFPEDRPIDSDAMPQARWSFHVQENPEWSFQTQSWLKGNWNR